MATASLELGIDVGDVRILEAIDEPLQPDVVVRAGVLCHERDDLTGRGLESEARLKTLLDTYIGAAGDASPAPGGAPCEADPALCEQLEALGYANP